MKGIVWTKSKSCSGIVNYNAEIGCIRLWCVPIIREYFGNKPRILGWTCSLYFEQISIGYTKRKMSLESAQKEGEKLAIKYLFSHGLTIVRALKRTSLLEDVLSEVGVYL